MLHSDTRSSHPRCSRPEAAGRADTAAHTTAVHSALLMASSASPSAGSTDVLAVCWKAGTLGCAFLDGTLLRQKEELIKQLQGQATVGVTASPDPPGPGLARQFYACGRCTSRRPPSVPLFVRGLAPSPRAPYLWRSWSGSPPH